MGSKNLKAIGVRGTGSVRIAGDKEEWEKLVKFHLSLLGANNQHVVPNSPQPWAEYYSPAPDGSLRRAEQWGAASPPIDTGTCDPHNLNRIAYRTNNAAFFLGEKAWKYTVRGNGCTGCPIRCHTMIKVPAAASKYGISEIGQNTCVGLVFGRSFLQDVSRMVLGERQPSRPAWWACTWPMTSVSGATTVSFSATFMKLYYSGRSRASWMRRNSRATPGTNMKREILPSSSNCFQGSPTKKVNWGRPWGWAPATCLERWGIPEVGMEEKTKTLYYWKIGHPKHHSNEDAGQCGVIINTQYNRDCQCHSHSNFTRNGLPLDVQKRLAAELWGSQMPSMRWVPSRR